MELLAVVVILTVISAFAVPPIRALRANIREHRAEAQMGLMIEAIKQMKDRNGVWMALSEVDDDYPGGHVARFNPAENKDILYATVCNEFYATGIPVRRRQDVNELGFSDLFACGYLRPKDFKDSPYTFSFFQDVRGDYCTDRGKPGWCLDMCSETGCITTLIQQD